MKIAASIPGYAAGAKTFDIARAPVSGLLTPGSEAKARLLGAAARDIEAGGKYGAKMTPQQAMQSGAETTIGAIGGKRTEDVIQSAASKLPEKGQAAFVQRTQGLAEDAPANVTGFIDNLFGGNPVRPLDEKDLITQQAKITNSANYQAAMNLPSAQQIMSPELGAILKSLPRGTLDDVAERLRTQRIDPASVGMTKVRGQWQIDPNGAPLRFWDEVKKNLDTQMMKLKDITTGKITDPDMNRILGNTNASLKRTLDSAVPEYAAARGAAAEAAGATNSIDLGMLYFQEIKSGSTRNAAKVRNYENVFSNLSPEHKEQFSYGLAGAYRDLIEKNPDAALKLLSGKTGQFISNKLDFGLSSLGPDVGSQLAAYANAQALNRNIMALKPPDNLGVRSNILPVVTGAGAGAAALAETLFQPLLWSGNPSAFAAAIAGFGFGKFYNWKEARIASKVMEYASDPAMVGELAKLIKTDPAARSFLSKTNDFLGKNVKYVAGPAAGMEGQNQGGRIERASGGRIGAQGKAFNLIKAAELAKRRIGKETEQILDRPDEVVVKALQVANRNLEG